MNFNLPSVQDFLNKAPSADSFQAKAQAGLEKINSKFPKVEEFTSNVSSGNYEAILNSMQNVKTPGQVAASAGSKLGLNINSEKVDSALSQIESLKESAQNTAISGLKSAGEKIGLKIDIPSQEDIVNMLITEDVNENLENKISAIEAYISSKTKGE